MKELLLIAIGSALVNNVVLSQFLVCVLSLVYQKRLTQPQAWVVPLSVLSQFHQQSAA